MTRGARYPAEFRAEAIRLYKTSSKPHREVAEESRHRPRIASTLGDPADVDDGDRAGTPAPPAP